MSKRMKKIDPNQMMLDLSFDERVERYIETKAALAEAIEEERSPGPAMENEFEACIEIAASIKQAIREWGDSRENLVEAINAYFGRTKAGVEADPPTCRRPLTFHMLNNYLSKPTEYPIPAYFFYAIHHITGSMAPAQAIVGAEGAKVATGREVRQMALGKLEDTMAELGRLRRELKGK